MGKKKDKDKTKDPDRLGRKDLEREVESLRSQIEALRARLDRIAEIAQHPEAKTAKPSTSKSTRRPPDRMSDSIFDVIIVGGGPAGLSAALVLGRCRRKVLVVDAGSPRNIRSHGVHGFITREGCRPTELLAMARKQIEPYGVQFREGTVMRVDRNDTGFVATLLDESSAECRKILLATGVIDKLPALDGIDELYGTSVHHCPYCDGWEHRDGRIAVYGRGKNGPALPS